MGMEFSTERIYGFVFYAEQLSEKPASILNWVDELPTHRWPLLTFLTGGNSWTGQTFGFVSTLSFYRSASIDELSDEIESYVWNMDAAPTDEEIEQLKDFAQYSVGHEVVPKSSVVMSLF